MIPLYDKNKSSTIPFVTISIIILNIIVYLYQISLSNLNYYAFINDYSFVPENFINSFSLSNMFKDSDIISLITNTFLHGSFFHLLSNMWILWIFGDNVEDKIGHFKYLIFYLFGGIAANLTHLLFSLNSSVPTIGASGSIAAVMGAYMIFFPYAKIKTLIPIIFIPLFLDIRAFIYLIFWFLLQIYYGTTELATNITGSIAWWAHIGGFIFGILIVKRKNSNKNILE
jgi:membrane associated rhomboid family serine protease